MTSGYIYLLAMILPDATFTSHSSSVPSYIYLSNFFASNPYTYLLIKQTLCQTAHNSTSTFTSSRPDRDSRRYIYLNASFMFLHLPLERMEHMATFTS